MSTSIKGFLQKKSLFQNSAPKAFKSKQHTKGAKKITKSPDNNPQGYTNSFNNKSFIYDFDKQSIFRLHPEQSQISLTYKSSKYEKSTHGISLTETNLPTTRRNFNFSTMTQAKLMKDPQQQLPFNRWTRLINQTNIFQAARTQSVQCLQNVSVKLQIELTNINYKLEVFHSKIIQAVNRQFESMKQMMYKVVDKIFKENQLHIRLHIKQQEEILASQLLSMKNTLAKEYHNIQVMKQNMSTPQWRKVAGELLSTELEQKIDNLIDQSRSLNIKKWEVSNIQLRSMSQLENLLRQKIKLGTINIIHKV